MSLIIMDFYQKLNKNLDFFFAFLYYEYIEI
nr:MAG TPA: hypothetical protein [Caudoviricetes sp.]